MAQTGTVTTDDVRTALNEADTTEWPDSTIQQKIEEAEAIIGASLDDDQLADLDQALYDLAVIALAKWRTWMTRPAEMRRAALDLNITYDAQGFTNKLEVEKDEALSLIGVSTGGASAAIADHTDGVFPDSWDNPDATGGGAGWLL